MKGGSRKDYPPANQLTNTTITTNTPITAITTNAIITAYLHSMKRLLLFAFCHVAFQFAVAQQQPAFWDEIEAFRKSDSVSFPPKNAILFVGSSSFRMWEDVQKDFPGSVIINRGFGGSSLPDVIRYQKDIIFPYAPKQIIIYWLLHGTKCIRKEFNFC